MKEKKKEEADNNMVLVQNATIKYNTLMRVLGSGNFLMSAFKAISPECISALCISVFLPEFGINQRNADNCLATRLSFQSGRGS